MDCRKVDGGVRGAERERGRRRRRKERVKAPVERAARSTDVVPPSSVLFRLFSRLEISERNSLEFRFPTL